MVTVWELKVLCERNMKDEQLTDQQRNAWENALKSVEVNLKERNMTEAEKLHQDIFYGRVYICNKCRKKNYNCTNRDCLIECQRMVGKKKKEREQLSLF